VATSPRWHGGAVLVLGAAGLLIAAGISLADTSDVDTSRGTDLPALVDAETQRVADLEQQAESLAAQIEALGQVSGEDPGRALAQEVTAKQDMAGFSDVAGPGLTVELDDAPVPDDLADLPDETSPDDYVVHQQDVEAVVNALWEGGAEAMQIMDRRLTSVSAVRCVGNVIILDGQVYSPPFSITAIGSPTELTAALERSDGVQIYRQWADYIGLGWAVTEHESVVVPGATGPATLTHATAQTAGQA
jgi:uncharacterized protein YlxW (UPF0749 family)